jgi:hypothetical protein
MLNDSVMNAVASMRAGSHTKRDPAAMQGSYVKCHGSDLPKRSQEEGYGRTLSLTGSDDPFGT